MNDGAGLLAALRKELSSISFSRKSLKKKQRKLRLDEVRRTVQDEMWEKYGDVETGARFSEEAAACNSS